MTDLDHSAAEMLTYALDSLQRAVAHLGPEAARDVIHAHVSEDDQDAETFTTALLSGIHDAIQIADDIDHGRARSVTVADATRATRLHFCWDEDDGPGVAFSAAIWNAVRGATRYPGARLVLPIDPTEPRQCSVDLHAGELFAEGHDYDGWALTMELRSPDEADLIQAHLEALWPDHVYDKGFTT